LKKRALGHKLFSASFLLLVLALMQVCAFVPSFAADQIIYDMSADGGGASISNQNYLAQSFATDSATVTLASVHVRIRNDVGNGLHYSVALYSSNSGSPGSKVADLAKRANPEKPFLYPTRAALLIRLRPRSAGLGHLHKLSHR